MPTDPARTLKRMFLAAKEFAPAAMWQPAVDVYRTPDGWLIKFDLAGVRPEDLQLAVDDARVRVQGVRRDWSLEEGCCHYRMEIAYTQFERSVQLPGRLDPASVAVEHRHGMLLVRIRREADHS